MENSGRYLINVRIDDAVRENEFFQALRKIDPKPLTVVDNASYAIKSKLGVSKIFGLLRAALKIKDTLLIIEIKRPYETESPEFNYWLDFGD